MPDFYVLVEDRVFNDVFSRGKELSEVLKPLLAKALDKEPGHIKIRFLRSYSIPEDTVAQIQFLMLRTVNDELVSSRMEHNCSEVLKLGWETFTKDRPISGVTKVDANLFARKGLWAPIFP